MNSFIAFLCVVLLLVFSVEASAHSYQQKDIRIGHIWTRATPAGATTAAIYVPLLNTGTVSDKLLGATTPLAVKIEIHQIMQEHDMMKMERQDFVVLEPNKPVTLSPNGTHLMVIGLKKQLKEGEMFPVTLQFEKSGSINLEVMVQSMGASTAGHP